ncbi:MAG: hypothetical protein EOO48_11935 [Flavobacterium sp.]|nr:MAG: hypothetical protein EOO48_11935 [Flavobacterium sp.]
MTFVKVSIQIGAIAAKLKNYNVALRSFVLFLTFSFIVSGCASHVSGITGSNDAVTIAAGSDVAIERLVAPYRDRIDADMNTVLSFAPQTLDKSGKWQTPVGNVFADAALAAANHILSTRENKHVDFCMLNAGGVRSIIAQGNVTTRVAYELMPFDNSLVVLELDGPTIMELLAYFVSERKPHPLAGITFTIEGGKATNVRIDGQPFSIDGRYLVATNDYLYNGGDKMTFFKKASAKYDLDYKLRNVLIDYFSTHDTIMANAAQRVREIN